MPALDLAKREAAMLVKRSNFAQREPGVIVVFCVVGAIGILVIALWAYKKASARKGQQLSG